jgi:hypothetical protein
MQDQEHGKPHQSGGPGERARANDRATPTVGYFDVTRTATYGFLAALPLLLLYEVMILVADRTGGAGVRVGAEVWIKQLFRQLTPSWVVVFGLIVVVAGVAIVASERHKNLPLKPNYFGSMIAESAIYAVVIAVVVSQVVGLVFRPTMLASSDLSFGLFTNIALSIGAGLYEELVFRVFLVGGLFLALKALTGRPKPAYIAAALLGAVAFSWVHYVGPLGDTFTFASFAFRFLFGLALNVVFLVRGFGVAAWTHALYDVFVVTHLFG